MDRFDRIFELHKLLSSTRLPVSRQRIEQELECSRATAKRIVENMRLYLNAPIRYDRERNGYYYDREQGGMYELPGIWFNASELHALLSVQQLLSRVQPGLLERQLGPLRERIDRLLKLRHSGGGELADRIRILRAAARPAGDSFQRVADALARRLRLKLDYYNRANDRVTAREVSPQRLVHYRDNWYLDAFCHLREDLRTFALDAIRSARPLQQPARELTAAALDAYYTSAYGIFSGQAEQTAVLRFSPQRARWVSTELWHPQQQTRWLDDGRYELRVPYRHPPELIMDILKYGPEVEVIEPDTLRQQIAARLHQASALYA
jgi:predicted DNA-binding transcriptional regulator YafY